MQEEWTEKYRPRSLSQIVGNADALRSVRRWAESWQSGKIPKRRALVFCGEPGTGKTSTALALANDMGWDHIEMNASDNRNADSIHIVAGVGSANQTFSLTGDFLSTTRGLRKLVIIDEADNLSGKEDKGGAKTIVETIQNSGQPMILIVNDHYELTRKAPAIKALAEAIEFRRLDRSAVVKVLKDILDREGVKSETQVLEAISENAGGDLRAAINDLQMMVEGRKALSADDSGALGKRNQERGLQEALGAMFKARTAKGARDATLDLDKTPEDLIFWIDENIPLEMRRSEELSSAFNSISKSDIYLGRSKAIQHYGLWSYAKELMTGGVVLSRQGPAPGFTPNYRNPSYFGMLKRAKGPRAKRNAVAGKLAEYMHTSRRRVMDSSLDLIALAVRKDEQLLIDLARRLQLDEAEIAYLLGEEPESARVARVIASVGAAASDEDGDLETGSRSSRTHRGLSGF